MKKCFIVEGIFIHISGQEVKFREHKIKPWERQLCFSLNYFPPPPPQMLLHSGVSPHLLFWGKFKSPKTHGNSEQRECHCSLHLFHVY